LKQRQEKFSSGDREEAFCIVQNLKDFVVGQVIHGD